MLKTVTIKYSDIQFKIVLCIKTCVGLIVLVCGRKPPLLVDISGEVLSNLHQDGSMSLQLKAETNNPTSISVL